MKRDSDTGISFFQRYLTVWVIICMVLGILIGKYLPSVPAFLNQFEYAKVSIPMAILIWLMIYPMMMKVDFQSIKNVGKNPKGLFVTWITNWLIKPFTMYGIASLFFFVIFKAFITPELATEYLAGAVTDSSRIWSYTTVLPTQRAGRNATTDRHCAGTENSRRVWDHPVGAFPCYDADSRYRGWDTAF